MSFISVYIKILQRKVKVDHFTKMNMILLARKTILSKLIYISLLLLSKERS